MKPIFFGQLARLLLALLFPLFFLSTLNAAAISSKQSGSWTAASTWEGGVVPTNFQDVIIKTGHTVTRSNAFVCQSQLYVYGTLVYQGNVTRDFFPGWDIEIQGLILVQGGTFKPDGLVYGNGTFRQTGGATTIRRAYVVENTDIQGGTVFFQNTNNGNLYLDNLSLKNATLDANGNTDIEIKVSMNWYNNGKVSSGTHLKIEDGATLTFDGGNSKHYNDAFILNYGTMYCTSGAIDHINGIGHIYNYGLWEFNVQANASHYVSNQSVDNWGGEILKKGPGGLIFSSSGFFGDEGASSFIVQQGSANITTNSGGHELNSLFQVDAGASLLVFTKNSSEYVPFAPSKFINNGNVYGKVKFLSGGLTTLEGNGKYEYMEIAKTGDNITLAGSPEITQELTLTSGHIVLNQYDLRLGDATVTFTNNFDSYIETNGVGSCVRSCQLGMYLFPVGNSNFAPMVLQLAPGSTQDFFKVRVTDSFYGEYTGSNPACSEQIPVGVVGQNWFVAEQTPGGSVAALVAYWSIAAERDGFDRSNCTLGHYVNGNWQHDAFIPAFDPNPITAVYSTSALTSFGLFGVFDAGHEADVNFITPIPAADAPICAWKDLQLHANTSPNAEIQWSGPNGYQSNDPDPIVPGIQLSQGGTYKVVAAQYGCPEKQASITVQVNAEPTATVLGPDHIQPGASATLTAYGGTSYLWNTGEATQAITVVPTQITDYVVTVSNAAGCTATVLHTVQVSGASATHEVEGTLGQVKIAPNPASNATLLTFESATTGEAQLSIMDARGAQLFHQNTAINSGQNQINISLENLPAGTYQVTLIRDSEVKTIRLVKMRGE